MASDALEGPVSEPSGRGQVILGLLDKAIGVQTPLVRKNIARARQRNPEATPAEVVRTLERMYVSALASTGTAVGATAHGIIVLGRVVPFGIGAVIGGSANATMAALAVRAARRAFGPAPQAWPDLQVSPGAR
ncbi:hypothetical protein AB0F15_15515 [Amycolatopsis sp. NPDC026612]|uniref:hypothetical protein n=1 Tax=Amycolatopsis sp. NPDC026612 TaxID=3155466 RepID=UPI0034101E18